MPRLCFQCTGICLTTEEKLRKTSDRVTEGRSACSALNVIRLVHLVIVGNGLERPAVPCRLWISRHATGSTFNRREYLPSCHTRGFPTSANFESNLSVIALMWWAKSGTPRSSCICLLLTYQGAPVAKRKHLDCNTCSPLEMGAGSGPPRGANIIHHGADELLI